MKKQKFNKIILGLLALLLVTVSCRNEFLETTPTDSIGQGAAVGTAENLMAIINGMHRDMYVRQNSSQGQVGQTGINIMMDAMGEDLVFPSTGNGWYVSTVRWQDQVNEQGSNDFFPYQFYYALVRNSNLVILNAETATGDETVKKTALGEAYAFRAFSYYMLVQLYGKRYVAGTTNSQLGVPLRLDDSTAPMARNTVEEVFTQINKDLESSLTNLSGVARGYKSHFNTAVVNGLKARVALTQGKYDVAAASAKLARTGFPLMDNATYVKGFNSLDNAEWMWGSYIQSDQTEYFGNFGAYMSRNYNSTNIRQAPKAISKLLYDSFPTTDVRTKNFDPTGNHVGLLTDINSAGKVVKKSAFSSYSLFPYTSQKFLSVSQADSRMDVPYMRSAEMYLIEAEALAKSGNETGAKAVFTELMKNRNPSYATSTKTGQAFIDEVLLSRRMELWGEGFRFLDLKRLNQPLDRNGSNHVSTVVNQVFTVAAGDKKWEFLIPKSEIDASQGLIEQNPK